MDSECYVTAGQYCLKLASMESNTEHTDVLLEQNLPTSPPLDCPEKWDSQNTPKEYVLNISLTQPVTEKPFQTTKETDIYEDQRVGSHILQP